MNKKLNELKDTSVRLLGVTKAMGIETLSELKEWYINQSLDTPLPKNMGRKTLMEIEDLINTNWIYDSNRPEKQCALLHGEGSNLHLHIQVHPNTEKGIL